MVIVGVKDNVIELCVSITADQFNTVVEMYPHLEFSEQIGDENIGWTYEGGIFTKPGV